MNQGRAPWPADSPPWEAVRVALRQYHNAAVALAEQCRHQPNLYPGTVDAFADAERELIAAIKRLAE
jgi:hypothetical protein